MNKADVPENKPGMDLQGRRFLCHVLCLRSWCRLHRTGTFILQV